MPMRISIFPIRISMGFRFICMSPIFIGRMGCMGCIDGIDGIEDGGGASNLLHLHLLSTTNHDCPIDRMHCAALNLDKAIALSGKNLYYNSRRCAE
ncbi:MAG: hypothetical protein HC770_03010 [Pseudanabaena sp. CRU_2_10]|nr:hypothetical protein [Pseudanabaena sp. CRU_2_10]